MLLRVRNCNTHSGAMKNSLPDESIPSYNAHENVISHKHVASYYNHVKHGSYFSISIRAGTTNQVPRWG